MAKDADDLQQELPVSSKLKIWGRWSGNVDEPVDLQVSVEVRCIPSTQIHLLNFRPSYISLIKTSIRGQPEGRSQQSQSTDSSPSSPLSTVSGPVSDNGEEGGYEKPSHTQTENIFRDLRAPLPAIPEESPEDSPRELGSFADRGSIHSTESSSASPYSSPGSAKAGSSGAVVEVETSDSGFVEELPEVPIGLWEQATRGKDQTPELETDQDTKTPLRLSHSHPSPPPSRLFDDAVESENYLTSQNLGKRTATDAFLTDSESESQTEKKPHRTKVSSNIPKVNFADSSVESMKTQTDHTNGGARRRRGKSSNKPSFIPKRASSKEKPAFKPKFAATQLYSAQVDSTQHSKTNDPAHSEESIESASQENGEISDAAFTSSETVSQEASSPEVEAELDIEETLNPQSKAASDDLLIYPDSDEPTDADEYNDDLDSSTSVKITMPPISTSTADTVAQALEINDSDAELDVEESLGSPKVTNYDLLASIDAYEGTSTEVDEDSGPNSPITVEPTVMLPDPISTDTAREELVANEAETRLDNQSGDGLLLPLHSEGPPTETYEESDGSGSPTPKPLKFITPLTSTSALGDTGKPLHGRDSVHELEPFESANEPKLDWADGILVVRNPPRGNLGTYKVVINVSVKLQGGKSRGWNDLIVPGLPKLETGESGWFLFHVSESQGMEIGTTNFHDHYFMGNCFFAEFLNSGDLIVPLRVCEIASYAIVKDFSVDQEIRADNVIDEIQDETNLTVTYSAVCSLRLHNRCFFAEKCSFLIYLDGGPDGIYRREIEAPIAGPPVIYLESEGKRTGVTHIQVTCSPKDLEMFCVIWDAKCVGKRILKWLPRIYPESPARAYGRGRHYLRYIFKEFEADTARCSDDEDVELSKSPTGTTNDPVLFQTTGHVGDCSPGWAVLLKRALAAIAMAFALLLLFEPAELKRTCLNSLSLPASTHMGFWYRSTGDHVDSEQINVNKEYNHFESNPDVYEVVDTVETEDEPGNMETEESELTELKLIAKRQNLSLRDKVDYFLGWKGPKVDGTVD